MDCVSLQQLLSSVSELIDDQARLAKCTPTQAIEMLNPQALAFITAARLVRRQPSLLLEPHSRLGFRAQTPVSNYFCALQHWEREMRAKVALQMLAL